MAFIDFKESFFKAKKYFLLAFLIFWIRFLANSEKKSLSVKKSSNYKYLKINGIKNI